MDANIKLQITLVHVQAWNTVLNVEPYLLLKTHVRSFNFSYVNRCTKLNGVLVYLSSADDRNASDSPERIEHDAREEPDDSKDDE